MGAFRQQLEKYTQVIENLEGPVKREGETLLKECEQAFNQSCGKVMECFIKIEDFLTENKKQGMRVGL